MVLVIAALTYLFLAFNDSFFTQNLRLSHTLLLGSERVRFVLFGEVFIFSTPPT